MCPWPRSAPQLALVIVLRARLVGGDDGGVAGDPAAKGSRVVTVGLVATGSGAGRSLATIPATSPAKPPTLRPRATSRLRRACPGMGPVSTADVRDA
jgi:hypothetical protein